MQTATAKSNKLYPEIVNPNLAGHTARVMKGRQVKAARELLGMNQVEFAAAAGIGRATLNDIENGTGDPRRSKLDAVEECLRRFGIRFVEQEGVIGLPPSTSLKKKVQPE